MNNFEILKEYEEHKEPIPSYEEWKKLKSHDEIATIKLGEKCIENDKLKELLEKCSPYVVRSATSRMIKNSVGHKKDMNLLTKIDEALK